MTKNDLVRWLKMPKTKKFFFFCYFFSPSLLMTSCLGNIQWRRAPTALISCCNSRFLNASCLSRLPWTSFSLSFLSLSSIHILRIESLVHPLTSLRSSLFSFSSALELQWSFAGVPFFGFVSNSFKYFYELAARFVLAPFRKNVQSRTLFPKTTVAWQKTIKWRVWVWPETTFHIFFNCILIALEYDNFSKKYWRNWWHLVWKNGRCTKCGNSYCEFFFFIYFALIPIFSTLMVFKAYNHFSN